MNITKKEISSLVAKKINTTNDEGLFILNSFFQIIQKELQHKNIKLSKFGVFYTKKTKSRIGRNPKTNENKIISNRFVVLFKPSNEFKNFINIKTNERER